MARDLRKLVFDNANEDEIRTASLNNGMTTLREAGLARVLWMEQLLYKKY